MNVERKFVLLRLRENFISTKMWNRFKYYLWKETEVMAKEKLGSNDGRIMGVRCGKLKKRNVF